MRKKPTVHEKNMRVNAVYGLLASGASRQNILLHCAEKYDVSERTADAYISEARALIEKDCEMSRPAFLAGLSPVCARSVSLLIKGNHRLLSTPFAFKLSS